jgi:hypothetical protein
LKNRAPKQCNPGLQIAQPDCRVPSPNPAPSTRVEALLTLPRQTKHHRNRQRGIALLSARPPRRIEAPNCRTTLFVLNQSNLSIPVHKFLGPHFGSSPKANVWAQRVCGARSVWQIRWSPLCTPGMGVILWGVNPLYVNPVSVKIQKHKY